MLGRWDATDHHHVTVTLHFHHAVKCKGMFIWNAKISNVLFFSSHVCKSCQGFLPLSIPLHWTRVSDLFLLTSHIAYFFGTENHQVDDWLYISVIYQQSNKSDEI